MSVIDMLQKIKNEMERLLEQLNSEALRIYEISTAGAIVERTAYLRDYYSGVTDQLQRVIEMLRR